MMKTLLFIIISALIYIIPVIVAAADQDSTEPKRWGIVTNKPIEDDKASPSEPSQPQTNTPTTESAAQPTPIAPKEDAGNGSNQAPKKVDGDKRKSPEKTPEKTSAASKKDVQTPKALKWDSEAQKETCSAYMKQLQDLFLKTRHYSIQGVPCQTAENAEAFLKLADKCDSECPKGLIEKSGYTSRIMRNIQFLEKLGNDRCGNTPPVTKSAPKPTPNTPQTQKSN